MALSPMMKHYLQLKEKYKEEILLYRLGDFYELFFDDAILCSKILGLTLTQKACGLDDKAPMCGVPHKAIDSYIAKLIEMDYKVAICEQLTEPKPGIKIVERDVVRIVTPGTVIDSDLLENQKNNYLMSIYKEDNNIGASFCDISTGEFVVTEFKDGNVISNLNDLLTMVKPSEIICNSSVNLIADSIPSFVSGNVHKFNHYDDVNFEYKSAYEILLKQFKCTNLKDYNCTNKYFAVSSAGALMRYLIETQKRDLMHINKIDYLESENYMQLDSNTRKNLELTANSRDGKKHGSLFWVLDKTVTSMGCRTLRSIIDKPLYNAQNINYRLNGVEELVKNLIVREELRSYLDKIYDIERLSGKISYGNLSPKDCLSLAQSLKNIPDIRKILSNFQSKILVDISSNLCDFNWIVDLIEKAISPECTNQIKDGDFIKRGYNSELDDYFNISKVGRSWITELETKERDLTGIKNLKIHFNKVFGYYIEVTNSQKDLVPYRYTRKQTVLNAERYITDELKTIEDKILNAEDNKVELEIKLFDEIREKLKGAVVDLQKTAKALSILDVIQSFATISIERNYVKPIINKNNKAIEIIEGRHPVVECILHEDFVSNDTLLNCSDSRTMIITGPNMAGKSTYMRQVALITLMAHLGCYVPAKSASISLTDRIFTRIGASDDLSMGQSTFMVEMLEVSNILKNATNNSLIILDEIGRGTSTFDGLAIAWSVMEYVSKTLLSKTLFATHFHELTDLEGRLDGVKNYQISVKEFNNSIIFLRKIIRGGANRSFGIEVASLAQLPKEVIERSKTILHGLEQNEMSKINIVDKVESFQNSDNQIKKQNINNIIAVLNDIDVNSLSPLSAFDIILQLKNYLDK